jgi:hypothetical protein
VSDGDDDGTGGTTPGAPCEGVDEVVVDVAVAELDEVAAVFCAACEPPVSLGRM